MIKNDWNYILQDEFTKDYFKNILDYLNQNKDTFYPPYDKIFNAFSLTSYADTNVVILGQDPYINENQANGLAFSVNKGEKLPPSLKNIYKEIENEFDFQMQNDGDLSYLSSQGVLLLNSTLTVKKGISNSHEHLGWSKFTDTVISKLSEKNEPIIFVLWGNFAIKKERLIDKKHLILKSSHPSPLSARHSFFGSNHFIKINEFLKEQGKPQINFKN